MNTGKRENRRHFIVTTAPIVAAIAAVPSLLMSCGKPPEENGNANGSVLSIDLTDPRYLLLNSEGGAVKIANPDDAKHPIILTRISSDKIVAFSSECTHMGCEVPLPEGNTIVCPCHGATFDGSGKVLSGPAKHSLLPFTANLNGSVVTISK